QLIARKGTLEGKLCYLAIARDISMEVAADAKQKQQEEALMISRNKLATAATLANIGPWEYDARKGHFEFNDEFYALYGTNSVREGKFMGFADYIREFIHPEDVWMFSGEKEILSLALPDNSTVPDIIHRIIRRDGAVRTVLVRRRFIRDSDGNMIKAYGTNQDITERIRIEEEQLKQADMIKHMAYYDSLTGIPNRNNLNEWLSEHIDKTKHSGASGTVFLFDLDQLKMVNDAYGHSFGDRVITTVSARLVGIFGEHAFIARIGGDEFIVILQGQYSKEQIEIKAQKAIESISKKQEYLDMSMHVTVSVGIAHYPKDGETVEEIIKNVENAMYEAKKNGRNCWRFYNKEMQIAAYKKIRLIEGLRYAITRGELYIVYQPQIILPQGLVGGVEALLRWNSKEYGNVSPEVFIPLAEQAGFINSIGNWVLMETCSFAHRLKENGWPNLSVAINISTMQVASADFVHTVDNAIRTAEIKPKQIEIEITESLLMASLDEALFKLNQIKAMGVNIALDDFGTGYSSLTYLRKLPVKKLKIDKSFIDMIETDDFGARMIGAIINMAKAINMNVVAEGVETKKQLDYLVEKGCACVQGYFFSKPLTETEIYKFLRDFHKDK
ncbi:MAG: EAL domain-containing protein, partial [Acidaminococcaceae bacterium]|nr:EAL domain-containing protein [Acidaminococcaceae bacterium]